MGSLPEMADGPKLSSSHETLQEALRQAHQQYSDLHPQSYKAYDVACKYMPGGNTRTVLYTTPFPFTVATAYGCTLKTVDGHEYTDFLGEYTAGIYGHNNATIRKAIDHALDHGWNYGAQHAAEAQLAQLVCERFPAMDKVRFVNSGTEANMIAIGTALAYTGKKKVLVFEKGYHGSTISGSSPIPGRPSLNLPHDFVRAPYNDVAATRAVLAALPPDSLAAVLVEPMLGSGGCFAGRTDFLQFLRAEATRHKALLIFDEVMSSRLAYHGYGDTVGIRADLMTVGKWIGGGMSFGAFGGRADVMDIFDPRRGGLEHAGTFNNNVISMNAGVAGCTFLDQGRIDELNSRGERMRKAVEARLAALGIKGFVPDAPVLDNPNVKPSLAQNGSRHFGQPEKPGDDMNGDMAVEAKEEEKEAQESARTSTVPSAKPPNMFITGVGSLMAIHFAGPHKAMLQGLFYHHMLRKSIYIAQRGFIALSIEINDQHVDRFVETCNEFCEAWVELLR